MSEPENVWTVLLRIKRKLMRERSFFRRCYKTASDPMDKDRGWYEMNVASIAIGIVDKELDKYPMDKTLTKAARVKP